MWLRVESAEDRPTITGSSALPGGEYTAIRNPNGTWDVLDIPILATHELPEMPGKILGKRWMEEAIRRGNLRRKNGKYVSPLHIHHHEFGKDVKRAGFFIPREVREEMFEGRLTDVMFADYIAVPDDIYQRMKKDEFPYRSVEIISFSEPEVSSLALLDTDVPYFRFPVFSVGREIQTTTYASSRDGSYLLAYQMSGDRARILTQGFRQAIFREQDMAVADKSKRKGGEFLDDASKAKRVDDEEKKKKEEEEANRAGHEDEDKNKSGHRRDDEVMERLMGLSDVLAQAAQDTAAIATMLGAGDKVPGEEPTPETGGEPVEQLKARNKKESTEVGSLRGEMAVMRRDLQGIKGEKKLEVAIADTQKSLEKYNMSDEEKTEMVEIAKNDGLPAMRAYASAIKKHGTEEPPAGADLVPGAAGTTIGSDEPQEVAAYAQHGPEALTAARSLSGLYDGMLGKTDITRKDFIHYRMKSTNPGFVLTEEKK